MLLVLGVATGSPVEAQIPPAAPPGPWVLDLRGVTAPVPNDAAFYPVLDPSVPVPSRGFGLDAGAHVYVASLGPSRLGIGVNLVQLWASVRPETAVPAPSSVPSPSPPVGGTVPAAAIVPTAVKVTVRSVAPQISVNFGSRQGWSYLSAGLGTSSVTTRAEGPGSGRLDSGRARTINVGAGARWFMKAHLAIGFDIRMHMRSAGNGEGATGGTPAARMVVFAAGMSVR